ncbi:GyrI-like domain-containing protein [Spirosoma sp. RP8]|uniref:GyrI-like domain-containing protein n=1 Tax=Spirosoma liriopis TaxID=2937440 RepID=A0ABT0HQD0_9BACT|nr:GyrI-like domain-containing protein [Spirosoma liriopis]MCK8494369.1 GyrI-like domain-containing protein [Spirosoma liriopis]
MQTKQAPPMTTLCYTTNTTLKELHRFWNVTAQGIYREANRLGLDIMGPVYWSYYGVDGNPDTVFRLEISLPVSKATGQPDGFAFKRWEPFHCLAALHVGPWENLPETYRRLMSTVFEQGNQPNGICREVYLNMNLEQPPHNVTEVQIGLA